MQEKLLLIFQVLQNPELLSTINRVYEFSVRQTESESYFYLHRPCYNHSGWAVCNQLFPYFLSLER